MLFKLEEGKLKKIFFGCLLIFSNYLYAVSEPLLKHKLKEDIQQLYRSSPLRFHAYYSNAAKKFPFKFFERGNEDLLVIFPGKGEQLERYAETIYDLRNLNRDILLVQFRGQGFSSRSLNDPEKAHIKDFDAVVEDLHELFEYLKIKEKYNHISLLAHSMGGHHGIRYQIKYSLFDQLILNSPMIGLLNESETNPAYLKLIVLVGLGLSSSYVPGKGGWKDWPFEKNDVSQSYDRYQNLRRINTENPTTKMGSVTVRWAYEALKSERVIFKNLIKLKVPIFLFQAGREAIVSNEKQNVFCKRTLFCHLTHVEGSMHNFLQEKDIYRNKFLNFVKSTLERNALRVPIKMTKY